MWEIGDSEGTIGQKLSAIADLASRARQYEPETDERGAILLTLVETAKDGTHWQVSQAAFGALEQIGDMSVCPALLGIFKDAGNPSMVRSNAALTLGRLGYLEAMEDLDAIRREGKEPQTVQNSAFHALKTLMRLQTRDEIHDTNITSRPPASLGRTSPNPIVVRNGNLFLTQKT